MPSIYFLTGPGLWISFIVFFAGLAIRLIWLYTLSRKKDPVFYNHIDFKWGIKSILYWLVPFGSRSMRLAPVFTIVAFAFHLMLLGIPLFLQAHNLMWEEAFGFGLWSMPDGLADALTIALVGAGLFLFIRRIIRAEVRILNSPWDYTLLVLTLLPFITGFLAFHQIGPYKLLITLHVLSGEVLLILIPITKLSHMVLFFFSRLFIGFEMGGRRGARAW
jgi:nitrate reductase gamma subunit